MHNSFNNVKIVLAGYEIIHKLQIETTKFIFFVETLMVLKGILIETSRISVMVTIGFLFPAEKTIGNVIVIMGVVMILMEIIIMSTGM